MANVHAAAAAVADDNPDADADSDSDSDSDSDGVVVVTDLEYNPDMVHALPTLHVAPHDLICVHRSDTVGLMSTVRLYAATHLAALPNLPPDLDRVPLMKALRGQGLTSDDVITIPHILQALDAMPKETQKMYKAVQSFPARAFITLNRPHVPLITAAQLAAAEDKERVMRGMPHGWGVIDPPAHAVARRLLVVSGVHPGALPVHPALAPPLLRHNLMVAWTRACATLGWPAYHPDADLVAEKRAQNKRRRDAALRS